MRGLTMAILCATAMPAMAEDWQALSGQALQDALTARTLVELPPFASERTWNFMADGRVLTDLPGRRAPQWMAWRVQGAKVCIEDLPRCARVERHVRGLDLRMTWDDGRVTVMRYVDL